MTDYELTSSLVRKSQRAMRIARLSLQNADPDSAVNRAYYAMFNISRAALLDSGVSEGELPRTHRGISEAFRQHAVLTGRVDAELASALSRAESLRLSADYTITEIPADAAAKVVEQAEKYVSTVERVFDLGRLQGLESSTTDQQPSSGSSAATGRDIDETQRKAAEDWSKMRQQTGGASQSLEEVQAHARENWRKLRQQRVEQSSRSQEKATEKDGTLELDGKDAGKDISQGIEDDPEH